MIEARVRMIEAAEPRIIIAGKAINAFMELHDMLDVACEHCDAADEERFALLRQWYREIRAVASEHIE